MFKSMTNGSPTRSIIGFALPILIANILQQFYNTVDSTIVGYTLGFEARTGVTFTGTILFLIFGLIYGMCSGFTVVTAQKFGANDLEGMRKTVGSAVILSAVITVVMTAVTVIGVRPMLAMLNIYDSFYDHAYDYIIVISAGLFAQVTYNLLAAVLRALGNSRAPLVFLIISTLLNILLDIWFIQFILMGTEGAAYATVISQLVSSVLCIFYIIDKVPQLRLKKQDFIPDMRLMLNQLKHGCSLALQFSLTAIGSMILQSFLIPFEYLAVAGYTAASEIEQIGAQVFIAFGTAMMIYCAQNIGAKQYYRIRRGFKSVMTMALIYIVVIGPIFYLFGKYLMVLFMKVDMSLIMPYADMYIKYLSLFLIPMSVVIIFRNGLQGIGYALVPFLVAVAELGVRWAVAKIGAAQESYQIICLASPLAWVAAAILLIIVYAVVVRNPKYRRPPDPSRAPDPEQTA